VNFSSAAVRLASATLGCLVVGALLSAASPAQAQVFLVNSRTIEELPLEDGNTNTSSAEFTLNIRDCRSLLASNPEVTLRWRSAAAALPSYRYAVKLQPPGGTCNVNETGIDGNQTDCRLLISERDLTGSDVGVRLTLQNLLGITNPDDCLQEDADQRWVASLIHTNPNDLTPGDGANDFVNSPITVVLSRRRPSTPTLDSATAGQSTISVRWTDEAESDSYVVFYAAEGLLAGELPELVSGARSRTSLSTSATLSDGIAVDQQWQVAVSSVNGVGNRSALSNVLDVTTSPTEDFFDRYLQAGGVEQGGYCGVAGHGSPAGASVLGLAALGMLLARRRRRPGTRGRMMLLPLAMLAGAGVWMAPVSEARADIDLAAPTDGNNALELRFTRFAPDIDSEFDVAQPYRDVFGTSRPISLEVQYDRQFWSGFGSLGVGLHLGYNRVKGTALASDGTESPDPTRLLVIPTRTSLVYRFDELPRRFNIPISLVFKVGLDYFFWRTSGPDGLSEVATVNGDPLLGRGGTAGWHASVGLHLLLDWFSPNMARSFASNVGVVDSYLFIELMESRIDDFGSATSWNLSQRTLFVGLAFEF
jgi:MYXO-CTERM domain-containing protein